MAQVWWSLRPQKRSSHIIEQVGWSPSLSSLRVDNWSGDENPYLYSQQNVITSQHRLAGFEHWKLRHYRVRWLVSKSTLPKYPTHCQLRVFYQTFSYRGKVHQEPLQNCLHWPEQSILWRYWDTIVIYHRKHILPKRNSGGQIQPTEGN